MFYQTSFQDDEDEDETDEKVMQAICALGSQDRGISLWITKYSRPICVAADVFNNTVYDLAW
jgi:protein HIRA/HIR1